MPEPDTTPACGPACAEAHTYRPGCAQCIPGGWVDLLGSDDTEPADDDTAVTVTVHAATAADSRNRAQAIADLVTAEFGQDTHLDVTTTPAPAPAGALRDDLAAAIRAAAHDCDSHDNLGAKACQAQHPIQVAAWHHDVVSDVYGPVDALADTVLAVVQPLIDRVQDANAAETRAQQAEAALAPAVPAWAQRCSCGGQGIVHLHARRHEPVGPAAVDPFDGRACPMCGDYATGPCPVCAPLAIAAVARARELHRQVECVNVRCKVGGWCIGCDPEGLDDYTEHPWPCPTIRALDTASAPTPDGH